MPVDVLISLVSKTTLPIVEIPVTFKFADVVVPTTLAPNGLRV